MPYSHSNIIRVRYAETDRMGYVYYGAYASYFEVARVETLRSMKVTYRDLEDRGILLPVSRYEIKYLAPATYDEELTIQTTIAEMPSVRIGFDYQVHNAQGLKLCEAFTELVFTDASSRKPCRPPQDITDALKPHFRDPGLRS